jgi:hypothetical protein
MLYPQDSLPRCAIKQETVKVSFSDLFTVLDVGIAVDLVDRRCDIAQKVDACISR